MDRHTVLLLLLGGLGVLCWAFLRRTELAAAPDGTRSTAAHEVLEHEESRQVSGGYEVLVEGGGLYVGQVLSVQVLRTYPDEAHRGFEPCQVGTFRFRVDGTIAGAPRGSELTLQYQIALPYPPGVSPPGLIAVTCWDYTPPRSGERLLLLLPNPKQADEERQRFGTEARKVWRAVDRGHPLVRDFEAAGRYLAASDDRTREQLFGRLCTSDYPSIRDFARDAAFRSDYPQRRAIAEPFDPVKKSRLVLEFLRLAVPHMSYGHEREFVTGAFYRWLSHDPRGATDELLAAFEDWNLTELAALDRPDKLGRLERCSATLDYLDQMLRHPDGKECMLGLFKAGGQAALERRLEACAGVDDPYMRNKAQRVLKLLRGK